MLTNHIKTPNWKPLPGIRELAWSSCLKKHEYFRPEPVAPGALYAFQFLGNQGPLPGSEAFRPLCVSLYIPLEVKETGKLDRTIGLRH